MNRDSILDSKRDKDKAPASQQNLDFIILLVSFVNVETKNINL